MVSIQQGACVSVRAAVGPPPGLLEAVNNSVANILSTTPRAALNNSIGGNPSSTGHCEDKWFGLCPILAGNGFCTSNCLLGSWTEAGCKKSCGKCRLSSGGQTGPAPTPPGRADTLAKNSNVDIAFMMDATASMAANIAAAKASIATIVNDVKNEFKENVIRMAFVAYRDYTERQYRIQIFDFTEDVDAFTVALGNIRAYRGGDYPEDVLGGINATLGLNWQAANKLFFQIGDAPPRGFCGRIGQVYEGYKRCTAVRAEDRSGPQAPDLFEKIDDNCMTYNVLQTHDFMDDMVAKFTTIAKPHDGAKRFKVYDMKAGGLNFGDVSSSIIKSIKDQLKVTNDYLNNPNAPRDRCIKT